MPEDARGTLKFSAARHVADRAKKRLCRWAARAHRRIHPAGAGSPAGSTACDAAPPSSRRPFLLEAHVVPVPPATGLASRLHPQQV